MWHRGILCVSLYAFCFPTFLLGNPAPAPVLQSPVSGASNVDPDGILKWTWTDDLVVNGSFETGMSPGWYTANNGSPPVWAIVTLSSNAYGMGFRYADAYFDYGSPTNAVQLIQDIYIPADATTAMLRWSDRVHEALPGRGTGRLRVMLLEGGTAVAVLEDVFGSFGKVNFVSHSTNLLAYAGQSLQLVFRVDAYTPL